MAKTALIKRPFNSHVSRKPLNLSPKTSFSDPTSCSSATSLMKFYYHLDLIQTC